MDKITLDRIELLHPKLREEVKLIYKEICERLTGKAFCRFTHTLRTFAEQNAIYAQGRTKPGKIVTFAKGGQSYHNYGLAIDIVLIVDTNGNGKYDTASWDFKKDFDGDGKADFDEIDFVFKLHGWKGLYKSDGKRWDLPHFQKTLGYTIPQLQELHAKQSLTKQVGYLNL
jgi:peptidoglycan L-alanyl-D-glutamate endopeptidase CwlK